MGLLPKGTELSQRYTPARMGGYEFFCVELSYNIWTGADNGYQDRRLKPAVFCVYSAIDPYHQYAE
ncbi:hypothetical protein YWY31_49560 [Paenibacillus illinoisensis]